MTIGICTNRKFLTLQVKKYEFTPVLPDFLIKCTKPYTSCRTIGSCGKSKFQLSFPTRYNRAGAVCGNSENFCLLFDLIPLATERLHRVATILNQHNI